PKAAGVEQHGPVTAAREAATDSPLQGRHLCRAGGRHSRIGGGRQATHVAELSSLCDINRCFGRFCGGRRIRRLVRPKMGQAEGASILGGISCILSNCRSFPLQSASEEMKNNAKIRGMVQFRAESRKNLSIVK